MVMPIQSHGNLQLFYILSNWWISRINLYICQFSFVSFRMIFLHPTDGQVQGWTFMLALFLHKPQNSFLKRVVHHSLCLFSHILGEITRKPNQSQLAFSFDIFWMLYHFISLSHSYTSTMLGKQLLNRSARSANDLSYYFNMSTRICFHYQSFIYFV